jgi:hypothetical protein
MEQGTSSPSDVASPVPAGFCACGCGQQTPIAKDTNRSKGDVKGQPKKWVPGHHRFGPKPARQKLFVEKDQRIGWSAVINPEVTLTFSSGKTARAARLRCDCGNEYIRQLKVIFRNEETASCGCAAVQYADRTDQRFGSLVAVRRVEDRPGPEWQKIWWLCVCDCGKEVAVNGKKLAEGLAKSCGCQNYGPRAGYAYGEGAFKAVLRRYQKAAEKRGFSWGLSAEEFGRLTSLDCHYCGASPSLIGNVSTGRKGANTSGAYIYNGLDRVDNALGYEPDNVCPCCPTCNYSKRGMSYDDFMAWIVRLVSYYFFRPDLLSARLLRGLADPL